MSTAIHSCHASHAEQIQGHPAAETHHARPSPAGAPKSDSWGSSQNRAKAKGKPWEKTWKKTISYTSLSHEQNDYVSS